MALLWMFFGYIFYLRHAIVSSSTILPPFVREERKNHLDKAGIQPGASYFPSDRLYAGAYRTLL